MTRNLYLIAVVLAASALSACGSRPLPVPYNGVNCIGMADDLKTLRADDELPRVVQVVGMPNRAYRVNRYFMSSYDVLEYDVGQSPCSRAVLHADKTLKVVFDSKGRYEGNGGETYRKPPRFFTRSIEPLVIDPVILNP